MYIALYRRFRPDCFANILGQDHIIRALKNQVAQGRVAHAYLFSGPRGTGKTSTAKVFARAINCDTPINGEACGKCTQCQAVNDDNNLDIIEIDAASNNGVDEIRDLREKVKYPPTICKYKVYIIDEVHMLSSGAFNALLKTLEEPPAHVVFILATTESHKLPATILSRCQRYDFHRITTDVITQSLHRVLGEVGVEMTEDAVRLIARSAEGGMRDALSIADMCLSYSDSTKIDYDDVARLIGSADKSSLYGLADAIIDQDGSTALGLIDKISSAGRDMTVLTRDLTEHFRNLMVYMNCKEPDKALDVDEEVLKVYAEQGSRAGSVLFVLEELSKLEYNMKFSQTPRILLEMAVIKVCSAVRAEDINELAMRLERLEKKLEQGRFVAQKKDEKKITEPQPVENKPIPQPKKEVPQEAKKPEPIKEAPVKKETTADMSDPSKVWGSIKAKIKQKNSIIYMMIQETDTAAVIDDKLVVAFPDKMKPNYEFASKPERMDIIVQAAREVGVSMKIELRLGSLKSAEKKTNDDPMRLAQELFGADKLIIKNGGNE